MATIKTKPTTQTVEEFLDKTTTEAVRKDCMFIIKIMKKITGEKPKMWGPSIIGFGKYHYKYESGHEGDMCIAGFSPRKPEMVVYLEQFPGRDALYKKLGKHKSGKVCLYIKKLDDVDTDILEELISKSVDYTKKKYPDK